jgi:alkylation response protein AidB-like acyl-CoA dehydrogenase
MTERGLRTSCCSDVEEHLAALRGRAREWGQDLGRTSRLIQQHPHDVTRLLDHEGPRWAAAAGIPERYGVPPLRVGPHRYTGATAAERVVVMEELARVDPSTIVAAPGPSMSGVLVAEIADHAQQDRYYTRLLDAPTWTFFALTEPAHGSDAGALETAVTSCDDGDMALVGEKRYVGNAARARIGVVFARSAPGPLGVGAYLVDVPATGLTATPLQTIGLRPVELCHLSLEHLRVGPEDLLGRHLRRSRRGLHASVSVFNRLRPGVAALALGVAAGALDLLDREQPRPRPLAASGLTGARERLAAVRRLTVRAALQADHTGDGALASAAKATACRLAEEMTLDVSEALGPAARFEVPELDRLLRDARGIEFMEGTSNIQLLAVAHGLTTGRLTPPSTPTPSRQHAVRVG